MDTLLEREMYVEKVPTGAIVVIAGEYLPVDESNHEIAEEPYFLLPGETAPFAGNNALEWKLVEAFDFAS